MRLIILTLASIAWLLCSSGLAEQTQQSPPQTPPPQTPPPQTPPPTTPPAQPPAPGSGTSTIHAPTASEPGNGPAYLIGCVEMDDGAPPPQEARVRIGCPGAGLGTQTKLDSRGCFRVPIGTKAVHGGIITSFDLSLCEVRPELPGYRVGAVIRNLESPFGDVDVGTIVLTPVQGGSTVSLNSLSAPEGARKAYFKAEKELHKDTPNDSKALSELEKAVTAYPRFATAWQRIGEIHERQKHEAQAREAFQRAITADPKYLTPHLALGNIELRNQRWADLAKLSGTIVQLNPESVEGQYFHAVSHYRLQDFEAAEKSARFVIDQKEASQYPSVHLILGDILSQRGDILAAATQFRSFLALRPEGQNSQMVRSRLQAWEQQGVLPGQ